MSGTLTYTGGASVGALVPGIFPMQTAMIAQLQKKLQGQLKLLAKINVHPPSLSANLSMALQMVAALRAGIAVGMPGIDFKIAMAARIIVEIQAQLAVLLGLPFATAGIHAYSYDGDAASFGAEVTRETSAGLPGGGPLGHVRAVIYATEIDAAWQAMGLVLRTS